jgi:nicotinate-nucleotide adenylyltransferase
VAAVTSTAAPRRQRLGIFGGAFNPIHLAHLRLAEEARECCELDQVLFLPTADPPHKTLPDETPSFAHRLAMVAVAIVGNPAFSLSDLEGKRPGKNYSVQILGHLHSLYPHCDFFFIIGMDSFRDLAMWHDYRRLFDLTNLVVTRRPGVERADLLELLPVAIRSEFCYDFTGKILTHVSGNQVLFLEETYLDISSTYIRQLLLSGRSVRYLLPTPVVDYIEQHALYRGRERL